MFASVRSFLYRHRRKFLVTGILFGGTVLLTRYARQALREWQERETKLYLERARKQQHYESNERTCNAAALNFILPIKSTIFKLINTEEIIAELKNGATNKVALWENLKLMAFVKVTFLIYISSMVMVTLRLQLNLLGGYLFRADSKDKISAELQNKYLRVNQHLLEEGAIKLNELITEKVKLIISKRSLKEKLTVKDIEQILWAIYSTISEDPRNPCKHLADYILPVDAGEGPSEDIYNQILIETRDLLECEDVMSVCSSVITRGLSYVMDSVCEYFIQCPPSKTVGAGGEPATPMAGYPDPFFAANMTEDAKLPDLAKVAVPMAKIIPIVNGLVSCRKSTTDLPHSWMQQLILMDNLKAMGANVYETFSVK